MRILYMVDNFSVCGGAHVAVKKLIKKHLQCGDEVGVVHSDNIGGEISEEYKGVSFYHFPLVRYSFRWFWQRVIYKCFNSAVYPCQLIDPWGKIRRIMRSYDVVCIPSEESFFRPLLMKVGASVRKVLLIHTNYDLWLSKVPGAFKHTRRDDVLFQAVDKIGVVGAVGANQLKARFPKCAAKIYPFYNLIDVDVVFEKKPPCSNSCIRMISLVRVDDKVSKDCDRMIRVARQLKEQGFKFVWDIYGGSESVVKCYREKATDIHDVFRLHGYQSNAILKIKSADLMILLSHYEGLPNVIYESLISGTPVYSTNVGGIPEQIIDGEIGWLVADDEFQILKRLKDVLEHPQHIYECHAKLESYTYNNARVWDDYVKMLICE